MGGAQGARQLCIALDLTEYIAEELRRESAILKERRKAREERSARTPRTPNK